MALRPSPPHRSRRIYRGVNQPPRTPEKTRLQKAKKREVDLLEMVEAAGIEPAAIRAHSGQSDHLFRPIVIGHFAHCDRSEATLARG